MNDCITTTKQSKTKPCAYFLGYVVIAQATDMVAVGVSTMQSITNPGQKGVDLIETLVSGCIFFRDINWDDPFLVINEAL